MKKTTKEYINHAFRWGSIIGFVSFVWNLIVYYAHWDNNIYLADLFFFVLIMLMFAMFFSYKRTNKDKVVKFSKLFSIGCIACLVISFFYVLYFVLRMQILDPLFFNNYMSEVVELMKQAMNVDYSQFVTPQTTPMLKVSLCIGLYITTTINMIIYTLIVILFYTLSEKLYRPK